jgi:hypothetical protein
MAVAIFCNKQQILVLKIARKHHANLAFISRSIGNRHKQFLNEISASYVGKCNKLA